jgi:hypothetical protein
MAKCELRGARESCGALQQKPALSMRRFLRASKFQLDDEIALLLL